VVSNLIAALLFTSVCSVEGLISTWALTMEQNATDANKNTIFFIFVIF
jgi:hypothetical protein